MYFKSVHLGLSFEEATPLSSNASHAAESYAVALCAQEQAHLSVFLAAPIFGVARANFLPLGHALADEVNGNRRAHAEEAQKRIASAAAIAGVAAEFHIVQQSYAQTCDCLAAAARLSDIVILSRPTYEVSLDKDLIEAMLFTSGRPVIVIPPYWERGAERQNILVAWDGGARAARAVGDAMPFLTRAELVEILCASPDASKSVAGADLAAHLARHCKRVTVTELQTQHGDVAKTLRDHATTVKADLLVMGAYAHPKLLQMALGGVTSSMLSEAELPLLLSY